jgi:hypothetical protein
MIDRAATAARLRDSLDTIEWAASIVPPQWTHALPDFYPEDAWTVAMNIAHLVVYEEEMALPVLRALSKGGDGRGATRENLPAWFEPDASSLSSSPLDVLLERLRSARLEQVRLVDAFEESRWNAAVCPLWNTGRHGSSLHSSAWVASKTFQHCWEHGNAVLRMALFAPR